MLKDIDDGTKGLSATEVVPTILDFPRELIYQIMEYLDYESAYNLAWCFVLGLVSDFTKNSGLDKKTKRELVSQAGHEYRGLFITALKLQKPVIAPGFCYLPKGCFGWGPNKYGQLGLGNKTNQAIAHPITGLKYKTILKIATGRFHVVALTNTGQVYSWGSNFYGQLGLGNNHHQNKPQLIVALKDEKIIDIAAGGGHTLALTSKGQVYSWGNNEANQLGYEGNHQNKPQLIAALKHKKITHIAAGFVHTIASTETCKVYAWGSNALGALGRAGADCKTPKFIAEFKDKITAIAAGGSHTLLLTGTGQVYGWGYNEQGQLGLGNNVNQFAPVLITELNKEKITRIAAGWDHTLALTNNGQVYSWGGNLYGQLGLGNNHHQNKPQPITTSKDEKIADIAAGENNTIAITHTGDVYSCGSYNTNRNLGRVDISDSNVPKKIIFPQPTIAKKEANSVAELENGNNRCMIS